MTVNTDNSTITSACGAVFRYELERKRRWNIGLRRHTNELTSRILVIDPEGSGNRAYSSWATFSEAQVWCDKRAPYLRKNGRLAT